MPEAEIERILAQPLPKLCRATIDDPERLQEELKTIRARGWANSFEGWHCPVATSRPSKLTS